MTESEKRKHRCVLTGPRLENLDIDEATVREILRREILASYIADGFDEFISGMSRGVDMWAADIVLSLSESFSDIRLVCAVPYKGFESSRPEADRVEYARIIDRADRICYVCEKYSPDCFQQRNRWMVDHASRLIAIWNGRPGGTRNTMVYACKQDIDAFVYYI